MKFPSFYDVNKANDKFSIAFKNSLSNYSLIKKSGSQLCIEDNFTNLYFYKCTMMFTKIGDDFKSNNLL